jgi:NtrC-family two-component system sensor histidine kinase KinB
MRFQSLQTRFLVAGCFLVLITVAGGAWSAFTLAHLSTVLGETLHESQQTIDVAASLSDALEREDDALLLALSGKVRNARNELAQQRQAFDEAYDRLRTQPGDPDQHEAVRALREHVDAYRQVGDALLEGGQSGTQEASELTASLAEILEREDDALLLALTGKASDARTEVTEQRRLFDESYARLATRLSGAVERNEARVLQEHATAYRQVGDALLSKAGQPDALQIYHQKVNPALRRVVADCGRIRELNLQALQRGPEIYHQKVNPALRDAVADCSRIRELSFQAMQQVALQAGSETRKALGIVAGIALIALGLSTVVMVWLAQVMLRPIRELTRGVEAIRRDDFDYRVHVESEDELGRLAEGFNRMAETLADYRKSSLGELLLAKATSEATLAALPDAVIVVDPDGQIVSKNPLAASILKAMGGDKVTRFGDLPLPPAVARAVEETLRQGQTSGARPDLSQALSVSLNGQPLKILVTVVPIPQFLPRRAGAAIVLADVTEFARLDELRSEVVGIVSHELKTPLTSLQMNQLLLREKPDNLTERQRELLSAAIRGGEELAATIDGLLDLTRIEAGQLRLVQQRVDLGAVIDHVVRTQRQRYEDANVTLRFANDAPGAVVRGDAARLGLVFVNLLTNALKYSPRGSEVVVHLASRQNAGAGSKPRLQITVTDAGPGIPPELRDRVFEKFFRVEDQHPDGPKGVRGTGIGLYLCREIIEAHGCTIACTTGEGGRGTRIAISVPADENQG